MANNGNNSKVRDFANMKYEIRFPGVKEGDIIAKSGYLSDFIQDPRSHISEHRILHFHLRYVKFISCAAKLYQNRTLPPYWMACMGNRVAIYYSEACWQRIMLELLKGDPIHTTEPCIIFVPCEDAHNEGQFVSLEEISPGLRRVLEQAATIEDEDTPKGDGQTAKTIDLKRKRQEEAQNKNAKKRLKKKGVDLSTGIENAIVISDTSSSPNHGETSEESVEPLNKKPSKREINTIKNRGRGKGTRKK